MLTREEEKELSELDKKLLTINIIDFPALVLVALGLFGKFTDDPGSMHPILANTTVTTGMLVVGGAIAAWCAVQMISVARRRAELMKRKNN